MTSNDRERPANLERRLAAAGIVGATVVVIQGKARADTMGEGNANKVAVKRMIERVWRAGSIDELPEYWTADCLNHADPSSEKRGLVALRRYHEGFADWFKDFDDISIEVQQQVAERDRVATQVLLQALHRQKQRRVSLATIRIDRMVGGKIAEHWSVADTAGVMQQLR